MGQVIRGHMIIMSAIILAFFLIAGRKVDVHVRTPQFFDIQMDSCLTDSSKAAINNFIESLDKRLALYPVAFVSVIKERFPFIESVHMRLVPPSVMKMQCTVFRPLCTINKSVLLVPPQSVCPSDYYCQNVWLTLPNVDIDEHVMHAYNPKDLVALVKALDSDIFATYRVTVSSYSNVMFEDRVQPRLSMVCRIDNVPTKLLCVHGRNIKELLESRQAFSNKSKNIFLVDLRFEKQIILSKR